MEQYKTFIIYLLIISFYCGFSGCINDPVKPDTTTISGKIYDGSLLFDGYLISSGDYPIVSSDRNGDFNLQIQKNPYDLLINAASFYRSSVVKYTNITNSKNHIILNHYYGLINLYTNQCEFTVDFPATGNDDLVFIKFISEDPFDERHDNYYRYTVSLPNDKFSISGKLVYLQAKVDEHGNVLRFEKFGFKDVILKKAFNGTFTFKKEEINFDPEEINSSINISFPSGYFFQKLSVAVSIPGYSKKSDLIINELNSTNEIIILPLLNAFGFKTKILAEYNISHYGENGGETWKLFETGSSINLIHNESITLVSPLPSEHNVTDTTVFEISDLSNLPAIYEFCLYYGYTSSRVYTDKKSIKFSDFKSWAFRISPDTFYEWNVRKYPDFHSVNEFLNSPFIINRNFSHVESVRDRSFKTMP